MVASLSPPCSNRHYFFVDRAQQGHPVTDNTEESPRPQVWQRARVAHVQNTWNLRRLWLLRLNEFITGSVKSVFIRRLKTCPVWTEFDSSALSALTTSVSFWFYCGQVKPNSVLKNEVLDLRIQSIVIAIDQYLFYFYILSRINTFL